MTLRIKTLADFKRALALPGMRVQGLEHRYAHEFKPHFKHDFFAARLVDGVGSTDFRLKPIEGVNVSYCGFGKAKDWQFDGTDTVRNIEAGLAYKLIPAD